jgi:hypothetical protein
MFYESAGKRASRGVIRSGRPAKPQEMDAGFLAANSWGACRKLFRLARVTGFDEMVERK